MSESWFHPKRYGYGAGLPRRWQGWAVLGGYGVATPAVFLPAQADPSLLLPGLIAAATLTVVFVVIAAAKTEGGWRWRWG